jgi:glyoxylase-like metal-dependent hydrolase (beta-lactamase superfamily II)
MPSPHTRPARPEIATFPLGDWQTNCHVVTVPDARVPSDPKACWIVDCGQRPRPLIEHVRAAGLRPVAVILTHAHVDHIAGLDEVLSAFGSLPVLAHEAERDFNGEPMLNLSAFSGREVRVTPPTRFLRDGERLELAGTEWTVRHVPGHSPGGIALIHGLEGPTDAGTGAEPPVAIVGDTLFAGSIGRVDFPTSDPEALKRSLREVLLRLPDATRVLPGHGPATTIGAERRTNPFVLDLDGW